MNTVLVAVFIYNAIIIVGTAYVVFGLGESGWWFALACLLLASYEKKDKNGL